MEAEIKREVARKKRQKRDRIFSLLLVISLLLGALIFYSVRASKRPTKKPPKVIAKKKTAPKVPKETTSTEGNLPKETTSTQQEPSWKKVEGVVWFRGNHTRTYYGEGPVPQNPKILWRFPKSGIMSMPSTEGGQTKIWTGTGWTGQPAVVEWQEKTWVILGAYDGAVHFLDGETGERLLPDFKTGDIIKGSVAFDPDGFPLLYFGSRDNYFRILALDRGEPTLLWKLSAYEVKNRVWNDDWDSCPIIWKDYLFVGGENSHFFIIKLNRSYDNAGKVTVDPQIILDFPAFDNDLFQKIGGRNVSIEGSCMLNDNTVYFANSGGMVHGIDVSGLATPGFSFPVKFKFWTGDDTDATIIADEKGMLYVCSELERFLPRAKEVGQIMKLEPNKPDNPLVWSVPVPAKGGQGGKGGVWATPALHGNMIYVPTHTGRFLGINKETGQIIWEKPFTPHAWGSPLVIDNKLIIGDTNGVIHAYDISNEEIDPPEIWKVQIPSKGALESTPVVWKGKIFIGSRDGHFYCLGDS